MLGAAMFAPIALIAIFNFGTSKRRIGSSPKRRAPGAARCAQRRTLARLRPRPQDRGARERARAQCRRAPPLLGAADLARRGGGGDAARGSRRRRRISNAAGRAAFDERDALRRAWAAAHSPQLNALLPFSRNDEWEISELRQRLAAPGKSRRKPGETPLGEDRAGGEGGIRTHGTVARTPHFECGAFDHSATSPRESRIRPRDGPEGRRAPLAAGLAVA